MEILDILSIIPNTGELLVSFPEGNLYLTKDDYCNMELAYAITIHKSQGSEFQKVHIVLPKAAGNMMTKRLLFTAVTRAKEDRYHLLRGNIPYGCNKGQSRAVKG